MKSFDLTSFVENKILILSICRKYLSNSFDLTTFSFYQAIANKILKSTLESSKGCDRDKIMNYISV